MKNAIPLPINDWPILNEGWVWLCGAGPGDPGLLTLHAVNGLKQANVIVYDALVQEKILEWANPNAKLIYAGKRGGNPEQLSGILNPRNPRPDSHTTHTRRR